jgi:hypothetical protein
MVWFSNYDRLACATMWTLFFAGDDFAPGIGPVGFGGGKSMQDFLQGHYIAAMAEVAKRVAKYGHVVGFDSLNEPSAGFIGAQSLNSRGSKTSMGTTPTPWEAIQAGSGFPTEVAVLGIKGLAVKQVGTELLGADGLRAWAEGVDCVWQRAGLWDAVGGKPVLRKPGHFAARPGSGAPIDFSQDYLKPFMFRFEKSVRGAAEGSKRFALFVEGVPNAGRPTWKEGDPVNVVDATHWYDDLTLVTKKWHDILAFDSRHDRPVLGRRRVRRYFIEAIAELKAWSMEKMAGAPTLLGEFGIPFDMGGAKAYRTHDYSLQEKALAANYDAVDASLVDSTIWNYTASNRNGRGDSWNTEDLSIFCRDDLEAGRTETGNPADAGGRGIKGFSRPYALATAGEIVSMRFDLGKGVFEFSYRPDPSIAAPTEIFVPEIQYPEGFIYKVEGGEAEVKGGNLLVAANLGTAVVRIRITRK